VPRLLCFNLTACYAYTITVGINTHSTILFIH
jgi:hypothetical protein